ncbi:hypothetical protein CMV_012565 [Castanea mollissima]|uniref:RRM domain-containing protein n=1 Tax=Castanea mollissima TaxID=60419 RepID=A0A8J4RHB3_9ROSI|nr:hypothetical protein CMV_012565 [Castanea mollissima]
MIKKKREKGEIVWVRVSLSQTCWPALVLRTFHDSVLVSFFSLPQFPPPRHVHGSLLLSFPDNFRSLAPSAPHALLHRALQLYGLRTLSSLTCPCQGKTAPRRRFENDAATATAKTAPFKKAEDVLGFVFRAAVSPWVERAEFVEAVEAMAFVQAFRGYKSAKLRGNKNKNSAAHESDILALEDEFQLLSQELEKNLEAGVTNGMSSEVPFLAESFNPLHKHQLSHTQLKQSKEQSVNEVLVNLHCLALDPFYLVGKCLNTVEHNVLRFRSLSFQNISDFCFKKCLHPKSPEAHFSDPGHTKTESGVKVHRTMQFSSDAGTSAYLPKNKAGHKENSTLSDPSFKLCTTMPLFSLNGSDSYLRRKHSSGFQVELINSGFPYSPAKLKMQHHSSTKPHRLTYLCDSNLMDSVQNKFNISLSGGASHCGEVVEIGKLQEPAENVNILNDTRACISSVDYILAEKKCPSQSDFTADKIKMLPSDIDGATSIRSNKEAGNNVAFRDSSKENKELYKPVTSDSSFKLQRGQLEAFDTIADSLHLKFPKDFELPSKQELVEKFSPFGIVDSLRTKIFSYISAAEVVFLHPTDAVAAYQYANKERVLFGEANIRVWLDPPGQKRIETEFSAPPPLLTGKPVSLKRCQHVTSDSSFKSQRDQQLEALATTAASTSLHMKFPKDFKLPSKQELVKKFSRFGTVDSSRTKVFSCTGAAQVVFLHPTDAVAAYQYAKKKRVVFGEANVRFWLDPLDHKRRGTKFSAPPPLLTGKLVNLKRHQHVTSDSSYKSQRGQQLEELATTAASTSLHIKFPKNFKLPSMQEVVKKFSRFGKVDSFRTNVSSYTGAAQVVFLHPTDAVAAYKYAKKKRVMFGEANVRFWLDPLDHKRRGTKFSVSSPSLTETQMNLKSCLKKSSPLECRDKKKPHKVRFLMET